MLGLGALFHLRVPPYHVYQETWFFLLQNDHSEKHILYPSVPKQKSDRIHPVHVEDQLVQ